LFTFRYHAISLIAVFLALGIGLLIGSSIGDDVVSNASKDLESSLRGDLHNERARTADLRSELRLRDDFERLSYPGLVGNLLPGFRIGIVAIGKLPSDYPPAIRDAVEPAGAQISSISVIRAPLPLGRLARDLGGTGLARVDRDHATQERFGERVGRQLALGGSIVGRVKRSLFSSSRGEYRGLDGIVFVRDRDGLNGKSKAAEDRFETGLITGLRSTDAETVGVEMRDTDPSQVSFMAGHHLSSVDDLDLVAGKAAAVYVLFGAKGKFGVKDTADQLLPPPVTQRATQR
jgi:Copper transport outer membrane protein, MctB